ncbi:hypothetical protein Chor_001252 [Crotalus horridus]
MLEAAGPDPELDPEDLVHFSVGDLPSRGYGVMGEIRRQGKLCDVTLKVGDHKFSAHRIVLAASIPYFHAMFTNDMMECKQDEIVMQGMDPRLHPKNCLGVRQFAEAMMCAVLYEAANNFVHQHFVEVSMLEEFLALPLEDVLELLTRDELHVKTEEQVYEAALAWVRYDRGPREGCLPELLSRIRLPLCRPPFLTGRVQQDELVRGCPKCSNKSSSLSKCKTEHDLDALRNYFKANYGRIEAFRDSLNVVEVFDPVANQWEKCQPMMTARSRVGVAVLNGLLYAIGGYDGQWRLSTIYVCGGYDGTSSLNSVEAYSPETDQWTVVTPMSSNRSAAGVTVFEGRIFVSGGHDGLQIFNSVEFYNPYTASWHSAASMSNKRCRHGAASLGGKLFVCGGYDGSAFLSVAEVYNSAADQWDLLVPMNTRRSRLSLVANRGCLYAVGGYDGQSNLSSVEVYDPEAKRWTFVAPMVCHEGGVGVGCVPLMTI